MDQHFGIRIAVEGVTTCRQGLLERMVVLYDAVVDECQLAVSTQMRVCIDIIRRSMCGPPGMTDANPARRRCTLHVREQVIDLAFAPVVFEGAIIAKYGNARTVVPPVFQSLEPFDEQGKCVLFPQIADNPAHISKIRPVEGRSVAY